MKPSLNEKEFALIQGISTGSAATQRELSLAAGLSLGMTNLLLKRLARKGYIKVKQLNWNKVQYLLTVQGAAEKARKSYAYIQYTVSQFKKIRQAIEDTIVAQYQAGHRAMTVVAWPETADVIGKVVEGLDLPGLKIEYIDGFKYLKVNPGLILTATIEPSPELKHSQKIIPLIDKVDIEFRFKDAPSLPLP